MNILKTFKLINNEINVNIQGSIEDPLFQATQIANILDMTNVHVNLKDFDETEKQIVPTITQGGIQNVLFLTEIGLYKLLGRSRKPVASVFQKWMINAMKEIRINGEYKLNPENAVDVALIKNKLETDKHVSLMKVMHLENVVYICKLREENNKILIKIGSSQNIKERMANISNTYENVQPILIDLIKCNHYRKYENNLHSNTYIKQFYFPIKNKQNKTSKETYLVTEEECIEICKIFNADNEKLLCEDMMTIEKLNAIKETTELKIKQEELRLEQEKLRLNIIHEKKEIIELKNKNKEVNNESSGVDVSDSESDDSDSDSVDLTTVYFSSRNMKPSTKTPFVYQYDPTNLHEPVKIYDSPLIVEREYDASPSPLRKAYKNNTLYKGYRWVFVKRGENPPDIIPETVEQREHPKIQLVAMIDIKKTKILNVYPNQKEATKDRLMKANSFHRAIKNGTVSSGHYWNYFYDCPQEMQEEYLKNNKLPEKYVSSGSKQVQQLCPITKNVLKTYSSNREVVKLFKMSVRSLKKYAEEGTLHNGYYWKFVESCTPP